ncbi:MAG: triose-phosphate isomerase [Saprospiraceae bacterium]|jgi:triosephosphate isomerase|nr:triose-phosphate isomerase [Saprospiraceae bacterium]MBP9210847.1 triose-phosphate isomerase [Saprospiraceae bacterium]MBV6471778.1 Triosephosphate isomerase [Saprospiraceae bacterium]
MKYPGKRLPLVAANWKMNTLPGGAGALVEEYGDEMLCGNPELVVCPPFTHLAALGLTLGAAGCLGAQNCSEHLSGAFTSEISAAMLRDLGCRYVILGHSECRLRNPMESLRIPEKIAQALAHGLTPIYCCGEDLPIRQSGAELDFIARQLADDLPPELKLNSHKLVIAYEPVWAIGTGKHASPEMAQQMHVFIRSRLKDMMGIEAERTRILYGGSVQADNAAGFASQTDIDGVLVGGASLKPADFRAIFGAFAAKGQ